MAELSRPSRVMRKRIRDADSDSEVHTAQAEKAQNADQNSDIEQPSVSEILKQRKQAQKRKHGLAFSSSSQVRRDILSEDNSTQATAAPKPVDSVYSRFTAQTGIIADAYDKKLEEYIDSRMRAPQSNGPEVEPTQQPTTAQHQQSTLSQPSTAKPTDRTRHTTLQEVDLPTAPPTAAPPRGHTSHDAPPAARRRRGRRTSADAQRDAAVDAILAESARGSGYGESGGEAAADDEAGWGEGAQADERIAAAFRAAYLDEVERERAARRAPAAPAKAKGRAEDALRGPKLGGSRSARAKFVEAQAQMQAKK